MGINSALSGEIARAELSAAYDLAPTDAAFDETGGAYERASAVVPMADWMRHAPYVRAINRLKAERDAVILAHNYMNA